MINFNDIKIIKELGQGYMGTVYLCSYDNKIYTLKIQKILEKDIEKNYSSNIWRELDLYKYIDKMDREKQLFFTKLYGYKIYNNCTHTQNKSLSSYDKSKWCVNYLLEYKGKYTLFDFLATQSKKITPKQLYSFILQIIHIIMLLHEGGYSHNDLHFENIMIKNTHRGYFMMNDKKIFYHGYQLSVIDYGSILNMKFTPISYKYKLFIENNKRWLFNELYTCILDLIYNYSYSIKICQKLNIVIPYPKLSNRHGLKKIFNNHNEFIINIMNKYIKLFPNGKTIFSIFKSKFFNLKMSIRNFLESDKTITKNYDDIDSFYNILLRIECEFNIKYPHLYKKYFNWCNNRFLLLPENECLEILLLNNSDDLINYFLNKRIKSI